MKSSKKVDKNSKKYLQLKTKSRKWLKIEEYLLMKIKQSQENDSKYKTEKERQSQISDSKTEEYLQMKQKLRKRFIQEYFKTKMKIILIQYISCCWDSLLSINLVLHVIFFMFLVYLVNLADKYNTIQLHCNHWKLKIAIKCQIVLFMKIS